MPTTEVMFGIMTLGLHQPKLLSKQLKEEKQPIFKLEEVFLEKGIYFNVSASALTNAYNCP
jgi:hypothetical protein